MSDLLNKQSIINLLIDSPLREPIKINLIDIVNNTNDTDLPKVYSTITKELEIFQKATERRMKLAEETIAKLGGTNPTGENNLAHTLQSTAIPNAPLTPPPTPVIPTVAEESPAPNIPPLDLPPLPAPPAPTPTITEPQALTVPPLDLPPMPTPTPVAPNFQPLGSTPISSTTDEDALAEIQKELDSLKNETATDIASSATPAPSNPPVQQ